MRKGSDRGSMMMEAVLVLPIFVLIIFFIIQISLVWVAKELTYYAAFCSARAAMVYNPADYDGTATAAAKTVLSWMSFSGSGKGGQSNMKVGDYEVPNSGGINGQVSVKIDEYSGDGKGDVTFPAVRATVTFQFPLLIPFGGPVVAYFFGASLNGVSTEGALTNMYIPTNADAAVSGLQYSGDHYSIPLVESCTLAKPYRTETFPRISGGDKTALGIGK